MVNCPESAKIPLQGNGMAAISKSERRIRGIQISINSGQKFWPRRKQNKNWRKESKGFIFTIFTSGVTVSTIFLNRWNTYARKLKQFISILLIFSDCKGSLKVFFPYIFCRNQKWPYHVCVKAFLLWTLIYFFIFFWWG